MAPYEPKEIERRRLARIEEEQVLFARAKAKTMANCRYLLDLLYRVWEADEDPTGDPSVESAIMRPPGEWHSDSYDIDLNTAVYYLAGLLEEKVEWPE